MFGGVAGSEAKRMAPRFEVSIITAQRGLPVGQTPSLPQAGSVAQETSDGGLIPCLASNSIDRRLEVSWACGPRLEASRATQPSGTVSSHVESGSPPRSQLLRRARLPASVRSVATRIQSRTTARSLGPGGSRQPLPGQSTELPGSAPHPGIRPRPNGASGPTRQRSDCVREAHDPNRPSLCGRVRRRESHAGNRSPPRVLRRTLRGTIRPPRPGRRTMPTPPTATDPPASPWSDPSPINPLPMSPVYTADSERATRPK